MIFFVPDNGMMYGFGEQKSATRDRQSSLKLTKNVDVDGRHCATKSSTKSMDLTREKADTNYKNGANNKSKIVCTFMFNFETFLGMGWW